jgi:hypothetical protein
LLPIRPAPPRSPDSFFGNEGEERSFAFFCSNTVPQNTRLVDSIFWSELVLQSAREEPAIKFGVLSLGDLHRQIEFGQEGKMAVAMSRYSQAVHEAQDLVERASRSGDHTRVLICAILFHCIENALGNHVSAKVHLRSGLRLFYTENAVDKRVYNVIGRTFRRFDFQAMTFWDLSAPYEPSADIEKYLGSISSPESFASLDEAANSLMDLMQWSSYINEIFISRYQRVLTPVHEHERQLERCREYIDLWGDRFVEFKDKYATRSSDFRQQCALLDLYHILAMTESRHHPNDPETQWDSFFPDYKRLIDHAEEFISRESSVYSRGIASFEIGIVIPLFSTALRCRDPHLRRRAIAMLQSTPRREGVWHGIAAARSVQFVVESEEEGLSRVDRASDIPDRRRAYLLDPAVSLSKREIHVTLYREPRASVSATGEVNTVWNTRKHMIYF